MDDIDDNFIPQPALSMYFNAARQRTDTWSELKTTARRLDDRTRAGRGPDGADVAMRSLLARLAPIECYFAYPGPRVIRELVTLLDRRTYGHLSHVVHGVVRVLSSEAYRSQAQLRGSQRLQTITNLDGVLPAGSTGERERARELADERPYFELLVVDTLTDEEEEEFRSHLLSMRRKHDETVYEIVVVPSFEDALAAVLLNYNLQGVVIRHGFPIGSSGQSELVHRLVEGLDRTALEEYDELELDLLLGKAIKRVRPSLDLFLVTDDPIEEVAGRLGRTYRRVFYRQEDYLELHISILKGITERYHTPFFNALKSFSQRPTGVFHALPVSRSKSITKSHWIRDLGEFYGSNVFLAETSATTGGLDSLSQPLGPIREAQRLAARAFGAKRCYFVTNGTSTANKIVVQSLVRPHDIVILSRDCHKSHHYALMLSGAEPVYLDPYPLTEYGMYGGVTLRDIKRKLIELKQAGKLGRVRMLLLTNCTFDGITYNPEQVMAEVLAIKPDMIFVWDEAWYAFAYFTPLTRRRSAMDTANRMREATRSPEYRAHYEAWRARVGDELDDEALVTERLLPDPDRMRVRVYATQSTHKTLTSLRQGSMILVNDQDFEQTMRTAFSEAFLTHTSTSPNYQILASLDVGRRQVELEGYELVQHAVDLAVTLRERISTHPLLCRYFKVLGPQDLVPKKHRPSGFNYYKDVRTDWQLMDAAFHGDEFCLDPTRITLHIGRTGMDGETFKKLLIERYDIQINKTSSNTVLFMTHIGSTRGTVAYLIEVLTLIAHDLDESNEDEARNDHDRRRERIADLTESARLPALPDFSRFHPLFCDDDGTTCGEGDMRKAFFLSCAEDSCDYVPIDECLRRVRAGEEPPVSAAFVTPYPPGFPILVPGQEMSEQILGFLAASSIEEIHGYQEIYGLRVFTDAALDGLRAARAARAATDSPTTTRQ